MLGLALALAGCTEGTIAPVRLLREVEGGRLAEPRPAVPRADQPYPRLVEVPPRPDATATAERARIAAGLATDRSNAQYAATLAPLTLPAAQKRPPEATDDAAGATMPAASTPAAAAPARPAPSTATGGSLGAMPDMPTAPPPPAALPGLAGFTRPAPPPIAPPPAPPAPAARLPRAPVAVAFAAGSATMPAGAAAELQSLARARGPSDLMVAGFGEAEGVSAEQQTAALGLAFARAQAIASVFRQAGVPAAAVRVTAEALGRGGVAKLAE